MSEIDNVADGYTCSKCGGKTSFNPKNQTLQCLYCGDIVDLDKNRIATERSLDVLFKETREWQDTEVIKCNNCGCKEVISKGQISTSCSFCGTNNIIKTTEISGLKPQGICPFEKTMVEVSQITKEWVKKKFFVPSAFKKSAKTKELKGVYSPAFTFDCKTHTTYSGRLGEREYYTVRGRDGRTETRSRMVPFSISGDYDRSFDDCMVQASANIPDIVMEKLSPFPTVASIEYDQKYLAGYTANTYAKDGKTSWAEGKKKMEAQIERDILNKYDHDCVYSFDATTGYHDVAFKYLLLPVYIGHHTYKGQNYNFYINGSTGKIYGKTPVSGSKIFFLVLGILAALGLAALVVTLLVFFFK